MSNVALALDKPKVVCADMADTEEIAEDTEADREGGCNELAMLHCVSGYLAPAEDYNLRTISDMVERFGLVTGLSDHTIDRTTAIASIIEKHFTLGQTTALAWSRQSWRRCAKSLRQRGPPGAKWTMAANRASKETLNSVGHCTS